MATLSSADQQNLTKEQQAQVAALKEQYAQAQKNGDTAAMEKAHADAEAIRSSAGYSGGSSGSGYQKRASGQGGQTADQVRQWVDDYTKAGYDKDRGWINGYSVAMNSRSKANYIRQQMQANSEAWKTADKETQDYLHQQNVELAQILQDAVGGARSTYNASTGQWENTNPNLGYGVDVTARDMPQVANSWKTYLGYTDADIQRLSNDTSRYSNFVDYNNLEKGVDSNGDGFSGRYESFANGPKTMLMGALGGTRTFDYNPNMEGHDRVYAYNPSSYTNQFTDYTDNGVIQPNVLSAMYGGTNNTYTGQGSTVDASNYEDVGNANYYRPNSGYDGDELAAQKAYLQQYSQQNGSSSSSGSGSSGTGNYSDYLSQMYAAALESQLESLRSSYEQNLSDLDASGKETDASYVEQKRQATGDAAQSAANWREMANAYGLNSGAIGQAGLAQNNQLQSNLNTLGAAQAAAKEELERQRHLLGQQYQAAINEAKANNDYNLAQALYNEAVRAEESLIQQEQYNSSLAQQYAQLAMQQNQWQQEFNQQYGSLSSAGNTGTGTGGYRYSSSSGTTNQDEQPGNNYGSEYQRLQALYEAASESANAQNYISSNAKSVYGLDSTSGLYTQYEDWLKEKNRADEISNRFANGGLGMSDYDKIATIDRYKKAGLITDIWTNTLLDRLGVGE